MRTWFFLVSMFLAVGCATGPKLMDRVRVGDTESSVIEQIGDPDEIEEHGKSRFLSYKRRTGDAFGGEAFYTVWIKNGFVKRRGEAFALKRSLEIDYLMTTPKEHCQGQEKVSRYDSVSECKNEIAQEQERLRSEIESENKALEQRRQLLIQTLAPSLVNRAFAPVQLSPMQSLQPIQSAPLQPVPQIRQPLRCTSSPNGFGGVQTNCY